MTGFITCCKRTAYGIAVLAFSVAGFFGILLSYMIYSDGSLNVAFAFIPSPSPTVSATATPTPTATESATPTASPSPPRFTPVAGSPSPTPAPSPTDLPTPPPTPPVWVQDGQVRTLEELRLSSQWTDLKVDEQIRLREIIPGVEIEDTTITMTLAGLQNSEDAATAAIQSIKTRLAEFEDRLIKIQMFHMKQLAVADALSLTLPTPKPEPTP